MSTQEQPQPHPESFDQNVGKTDDDFKVMVTMLRRSLRAESHADEGLFGPAAWSQIDVLTPLARKLWGRENHPWKAVVDETGKMTQ